ncbi:hypothetical protein LPN01_00520 [Sphingomonas sp. A2-49]|uniref:hypothetical protein n=1 Tax=Sphingomonas sp. A2-49 TaxID=1391375 RepID=UPI0021D32C5A|nr:hypothetical protein [Sphingomonas sp. A2-49]MCU6452556.1 hypothetical protein [Sphingomonas sp. A2-49]
MSVGQDHAERSSLGTRISAARRLGALADLRLSAAIDDLFRSDAGALDERLRLTLRTTIAGIVTGIETDLRRHAARVLAGRGADALAERVLQGRTDVVLRLSRAGLIRDRLLMDELIAQVRCDLLAEGLPPAVAGSRQASVLVRLAEVDDPVVAAAARALLAADAGRRTASEAGGISPGRLSAERHHQLIWWVAAAIRGDDDVEIDHAIVLAAQRSLAAHDEGQRPEALAVRLAAAIDARPDEVGDLLIESLGDRRLVLFVAVLGRAIGLDFDATLGIVLEPEGDRLWLALRAAGLDRPSIARIALALADADPRRDIETFADDLDDIATVPDDAARSALAPLALHRDLRLAIDALAREAAR